MRCEPDVRHVVDAAMPNSPLLSLAAFLLNY